MAAIDIAIVGAGAAGAMAARTARAAGASVRVFEAGPRVGGRLQNARMVAMCGGDLSFDHGGQFVTFRDPEFEALTGQALADKALAPLGATGQLKAGVWCPFETGPRFRGRPDMASFVAWLLRDVAVETACPVAAVEPAGPGFAIVTGQDRVEARAVVLAVPPSALEGLGFDAPCVSFDPCWAVSVAFDQKIESQFAQFEISGSALGWAARQPAWRDGERFGRDRWVVQFSADFSRTHAGKPAGWIEDQALAAFAGALGDAVPAPAFSFVHLWREARVTQPLGAPFQPLADGLVAAGDWCLGGRVEAALLSGRGAAHAVL